MSRRSDLLWVTLLAAVVFLAGIGSRDLWNPDEPRYAEVAREMLEDGEFLMPHLNGRLYLQKPPLHFWNIAFFGVLRGGVDEVAARLPSVLAAIGCTLLVFLMGRMLASRLAAWVSVAAFLGCFKILMQGRVGQIDMTLAFFAMLGLWFWMRGYFEQRPRLYPWFFVWCGVATIAKGPAGFLPYLLGVVAFLLLERDFAQLRAFRVGRGLLLYLGVVALWFVPAVLVGGRPYFEAMILDQTLERYAAGAYHPAPWYYFLTTIPADFLPMTFVLPVALAAAWRETPPEKRATLRWLLVWAASIVAFFSVSPSKRTVYVLVVYAPLALIVGLGFDRIRAVWPRYRTATVVSFVLAFLLLVALPIAVPIAAERYPEYTRLVDDLVLRAVLCLLIPVAGALAAVILGLRDRPAAGAAALGLGMAAFFTVASVVLLPIGDTFKSARSLAGVLVENARPDEPWAVYPMLDAAFLFYSERFSVDIKNEEELHDYVHRRGRFADLEGRHWLLIEREELEALGELPLVEVARDDDFEDGHVLLTEPPWPRETDGDSLPSGSSDPEGAPPAE